MDAGQQNFFTIVHRQTENLTGIDSFGLACDYAHRIFMPIAYHIRENASE
jgi:hypothetical protein